MFVDTNVFVPARFEAAPAHAVARAALDRAVRAGEALRISRQVMREYLGTATRPQAWSPPVPMAVALADLSWMEAAFEILEDGPRVMETLAALCREIPVGGKQVHDANIVATMLAHGERRLLTFNIRDFRRYRRPYRNRGPGGRGISPDGYPPPFLSRSGTARRLQGKAWMLSRLGSRMRGGRANSIRTAGSCTSRPPV